MHLGEFLKRSWESYSRITPDAARIHALLQSRGEREIVNDHVAYRTFGVPGIDRLALGRFFESWGYRKVADDLEFPEKKLRANYWLHPDASQPKVFISELKIELVEPWLRDWILTLCAPLRDAVIDGEFFFRAPWPAITFSDYSRLAAVSEYAAWTAAFGVQVNHFTVLVNSLKTVASLPELNSALRAAGIRLSDAGGLIKGVPAEYLEQTSTQAGRVEWTFADGRQSIPSCYYEFARRYPLPDGQGLFDGFLPKSADKIFESTFERK